MIWVSPASMVFSCSVELPASASLWCPGQGLGRTLVAGAAERGEGGHLPLRSARYTRRAENDHAKHAKPAAWPLTSTNTGSRSVFKPRTDELHNPQTPQRCGVCGI
jgi:hypothetical protein